MAKKYLSNREIQLSELHILEKFADFCNKNSLRYFAHGGTLLGAVRHNGFIPWDDDVDLIMPRPDYEKLITLIKNGAIIDNDLFVTAPELQDNPDFPFMKVFDKTTMIESGNEVFSDYIWIDVFPLDGLKTPPEKELKKIIRLQKIFFQKRTQEKKKYKDGITKTRKALGVIKRLPLKLVSYSKFVSYFLNRCKSIDYDSAEYVSYPVWAAHPGNILKKEWLDKTIHLPFEDIKVSVFSGYKHYLKNRYGNYMKLPPKEQQVTHNIKAYRIDKKNKL